MIELINGIYVNWDKSKVIKNSLCNGKVYATYNDQNLTSFNWWMSRKQINLHKKNKEN